MKDLFITEVKGGTLLPSAPDPSKGSIQVLVSGRTKPGATQEWHLKLPVLDALYLLNLLEGLAHDGQIDHLRHPPKTPTQ
jgi:hypothetical protein